MAATLLLDTVAWDLVLGADGNIAVATEPYAIAQDAASGIRTCQGECWYDTTIGIPYFASVLGEAPSLSLMKSFFVQAALRVPDAVSAVAFISGFTDRVITGQVQITDSQGNVSTSAF
jgi:hypothetical protein